MYSFLFDRITDPLGLPISPLYEYIVLLILNRVAFRFAWDASPGGFGGSTIHWVVRLTFFIFIWAAAYGIIFTIKWCIANWILLLKVMVSALVMIAILLFALNRRKLQQS